MTSNSKNTASGNIVVFLIGLLCPFYELFLCIYCNKHFAYLTIGLFILTVFIPCKYCPYYVFLTPFLVISMSRSLL